MKADSGINVLCHKPPASFCCCRVIQQPKQAFPLLQARHRYWVTNLKVVPGVLSELQTISRDQLSCTTCQFGRTDSITSMQISLHSQYYSIPSHHPKYLRIYQARVSHCTALPPNQPSFDSITSRSPGTPKPDRVASPS